MWTPPFGPLVITFDQVLRPGPHSTGNYYIRRTGVELPITGAYATGSTVVLASMGGGPPDPGPDVVTYYADPKNIRGGIIPHYPTAAFADFPYS